MFTDFEKAESWMDDHRQFVQDYFMRKASRQMVQSWIQARSSPQGMVPSNSSSSSCSSSFTSDLDMSIEFKTHSLLRYMEKTIDGVPTYLSQSNSRDNIHFGHTDIQSPPALGDRDLISELVKDILNNLDIPSLCHKILQNFNILFKADKCSLSQMPGGNKDHARFLESQLSDLPCSSTEEQMQQTDEMRFPWWSEILRNVAEKKDLLNQSDCYQDFFWFLQFCDIALRNAELYERSQLEIMRNQVLLDLTRMVFEEQSTVEHIVYRIMTYTLSLLQCERCQILLVDENTKTFLRVFDLEINDIIAEDAALKNSPFEGGFPVNIELIEYVATTGEILNISDVRQDDRFHALNGSEGFSFYPVLCMPIRNAANKIIGVSQFINKLNGLPFSKNDEQLFEAFAIFCGMGIQNTQMYEKATKAVAKTKITIEVLSYHATASIEEAKKLSKCTVPSTYEYKLQDFKFNNFSLDDESMIKACLRMFKDLDLIERFHIKYDVLCRWLLSVRKNYRPVTYHNWSHAFNVTQMMFACLKGANLCRVFGAVETLALLIACLCHDLDHRGTNNSFQKQTCSYLAQLYSTSTMEHHHFDQCIMILNCEGNQILSELSPDEYSTVLDVLEDAILATDLAVYFRFCYIFV